MKKAMLFAAVCILALGVTTPTAWADLDTIDSSYVGLITPDHPANLATELNLIDLLINKSQGSGQLDADNTYVRSGNFQPAPGGLPDPHSLTWTDCPNCGTATTLTVQGYILGKYDGKNAGMYVWYFATPTTVTLPQNDPTEDKYGLSHYAYNESRSVPDGGFTLMLLGGALCGLEGLRRKFRG